MKCAYSKAEKACSKCKMALYCSHDCQLSHWKESHKVACKALRSKFGGKTWVHSSLTEDAVEMVANPEEYEERDPNEVKEAFRLASEGFNLLTGKNGFLDGLADDDDEGIIESGPVDRKRAMDLIEKAAEMGDPAAQYQTALFYRDDNEDNKTAVHWFNEASFSNHAEASMTIGFRCYLEGGVLDKHAVGDMRNALAHGVSKGGHSDPYGKYLSAKSFDRGLQTVVGHSTKLYLEACEEIRLAREKNSEWGMVESHFFLDKMALAADSGSAPSIDFMLLIESTLTEKLETEELVNEYLDKTKQDLTLDTTQDYHGLNVESPTQHSVVTDSAAPSSAPVSSPSKPSPAAASIPVPATIFMPPGSIDSICMSTLHVCSTCKAP